MFQCLECDCRFETTLYGRQSCPRCGGGDIDLVDTAPPDLLVGYRAAKGPIARTVALNQGGLTERVPLIIINTLLAGSAGLVAALVMGMAVWKYIDVRLVINASLAGLVAITAGAHAVTGLAAIFIGAMGAVVVLLMNRLLERLRIDDAVGAIPVHLAHRLFDRESLAVRRE